MQEILNILSSLGFNWHVALANFVNFLIILFIVNKFFFGKIGKVIKEREDVIKKGLKDAGDARALLLATEEEKARSMHAAKKEGERYREEAQAKAHKEGDEIRRLAEEESQERLKALSVKENTLMEKVEKELREKAPSLIAELYAKTLSKTMTEKDNNAFIASLQ